MKLSRCLLTLFAILLLISTSSASDPALYFSDFSPRDEGYAAQPDAEPSTAWSGSGLGGWVSRAATTVRGLGVDMASSVIVQDTVKQLAWQYSPLVARAIALGFLPPLSRFVHDMGFNRWIVGGSSLAMLYGAYGATGSVHQSLCSTGVLNLFCPAEFTGPQASVVEVHFSLLDTLNTTLQGFGDAILQLRKVDTMAPYIGITTPGAEHNCNGQLRLQYDDLFSFNQNLTTTVIRMNNAFNPSNDVEPSWLSWSSELPEVEAAHLCAAISASLDDTLFDGPQAEERRPTDLAILCRAIREDAHSLATEASRIVHAHTLLDDCLAARTDPYSRAGANFKWWDPSNKRWAFLWEAREGTAAGTMRKGKDKVTDRCQEALFKVRTLAEAANVNTQKAATLLRNLEAALGSGSGSYGTCRQYLKMLREWYTEVAKISHAWGHSIDRQQQRGEDISTHGI